MRFIDLLKRKLEDNLGNRTPVIAFLGDSVTQGCFEVYLKDSKIKTVFDSSKAYCEKVKKIFAMLYPEAPVSVVNLGVNGSSATQGVARMKEHVLSCNPDLLIVCFGLNDSARETEGIPIYKEALRQIFIEAKNAGIETIFMTPNMMNTYTSHIVTEEIFRHLAEVFAKRQTNGVLDAYIDAAREVCSEEDVLLCDCYAIWKRLYESGADTTALLSNGLNHPTREMHELFAWQLVNTILNN